MSPPKFVVFTGAMPEETSQLLKKTIEVRKKAFGVYELNMNEETKEFWYEHTSETSVALWYSKDDGWKIGWKTDKDKADAPAGWLYKNGSVHWAIGIETGWIDAPSVDLLECAPGKFLIPHTNASYYIDTFKSEQPRRVHKRMRPDYDEFEKGNIDAPGLQKSLKQAIEDEEKETKQKIALAQEKLLRWDVSFQQTSLFKEELCNALLAFD